MQTSWHTFCNTWLDYGHQKLNNIFAGAGVDDLENLADPQYEFLRTRWSGHLESTVQHIDHYCAFRWLQSYAGACNLEPLSWKQLKLLYKLTQSPCKSTINTNYVFMMINLHGHYLYSSTFWKSIKQRCVRKLKRLKKRNADIRDKTTYFGLQARRVVSASFSSLIQCLLVCRLIHGIYYESLSAAAGFLLWCYRWH